MLTWDKEVCYCSNLPLAVPATPLFSTFSPPDLLDRHILLGAEIHAKGAELAAKQLESLPLPSQGGVAWTHFGGIMPSVKGTLMH